MKIQAITQKTIPHKNEQQPSFKGADEFLRFLATNQAWGANGTDLAFMVLPRTTTDMVNRGIVPGLETARRESMGTINDTMIGPYGVAAGALLSAGLQKKCPVAWNEIFAGKETIDHVANTWNTKLENNLSRKDVFKSLLSDLEGFEPTNPDASKDGFVKISNIDEIAETLDKAADKIDVKKWRKSSEKDLVRAKIVENTGVDKKFRIRSKNQTIETTLDSVLDDYFKLVKTFDSEPVAKQFNSELVSDSAKKFSESSFVKDLKKLGRNKAIGGIATAAAVGMSVQPINMYLSKKKTGSDGFVGVEGREKDNSLGFKVLKLGVTAAFGAMVLKTIGCKPKEFIDRMAYKNRFTPTLDQFKGVYGLTIMSRIMASRDKDECREVCVKDTLGFLNWLVLGNFVNKITAKKLDPELIKYNEVENGKGWWNRLTKSSLKTHDEIMFEAMKNAGKSPIIKEVKDGKTVEKVMKFSQMKEALGKTSPVAKKALKQLKFLNIAQIAGYAYTGLILGIGVPKLNIAMTNSSDKKRRTRIKNMINSQENQEFLKQRMFDQTQKA